MIEKTLYAQHREVIVDAIELLRAELAELDAKHRRPSSLGAKAKTKPLRIEPTALAETQSERMKRAWAERKERERAAARVGGSS